MFEVILFIQSKSSRVDLNESLFSLYVLLVLSSNQSHSRQIVASIKAWTSSKHLFIECCFPDPQEEIFTYYKKSLS